MNILFVTPQTSEYGMVVALRQLVPTVTLLNYRSLIRCHGIAACHRQILEGATQHDVVLVDKGMEGGLPPLSPSVLEQAGRHATTVYWLHDAVLDERRRLCLSYAKACHIVSATNKLSCDKMASLGVRRINQVFQGYEATWFYAEQTPIAHDLTFVGRQYGGRSEFIRLLAEHGMQVHCPSVPVPEAGDVYRRARICLNFTSIEWFSNRVVRTLACQAFLLSQRCADLEVAFRDGRDLVLWDTQDELVEKARFYLTNEDGREAIAANGAASVRRFTWLEQMKKLIRIIEDGETIIDGAFRPGGDPK